MEQSPIPNKKSIALLNPGSFREERARLSRHVDGRMDDGRTDGRLHNSDSRDEGSKTSESIVLRAVHKGRRLGGWRRRESLDLEI